MTYHDARIAALLLVLTIAAITDIRTGKIYNWLTYPAALLGLGLALGFGGGQAAIESLTGLAVGFLPLYVFFLIGGTGGGDAKLMGAVGALALTDLTLAIMVYGMIVGAAMAVIMMIWSGAAWATLKRVGHAVGLVLLGKKPGDPSPADGPRVRLGVAFWIGCCWALLERRMGMSALDAVLGVWT